MIAPPSQHISEHDAVMLQAIRNLSAVFEVDGPGLEPYKTQLAREPSVTERALAWKARRREDA